jgi:hypothetical protein
MGFTEAAPFFANLVNNLSKIAIIALELLEDIKEQE